MNDKIFSITDARGGINEYKQLTNGTWAVRCNFEEWFGLNGEPPASVVNESQRKPTTSYKPNPSKAIPITRKRKGTGLSGYDKFFIGNAEWYGNKLFASLPPSGPWILQFVLSQIIRDTSNTWKFNNAELLEALSDKHYLWANLSLDKIVEKAGASRPTVVKTLKAAEGLGAIVSVPGLRKHVDNTIYICGIKNYTKYDPSKDNQEWLFVDSPLASDIGKIPTELFKPLKTGLMNHQIMVDGMDLIKTLFTQQNGQNSSSEVVKKLY